MSTADDHSSVLHAALAWHHAGCSVVPVAANGTKMPNLASWKQYQSERADETQLRRWFDTGHPGIGIITGAVSGNLELLEVEGRGVTENLPAAAAEIALASGLADLWRRVLTGYLERTPSGGLHLLYRVDGPVAGNTKLARRPATPAELEQNPRDKIKVLAETRGEGGFVVIAPSHGAVHPSGQPWQVAMGGPDTLPTISSDERDALHALFRALDQMPAAQQPVGFAKPTREPAGGGISPGDDFNARTDWSEILTPVGWKQIWVRGTERGWRRPGKADIGISATTGYGDGDWLYVFTTSTEFDSETTYTKFAAFTLLHHGGDYSAAASVLRGRGYGSDPAPEPRPVVDSRTKPGQSADTPATVGAEPTVYERTDDGNATRLVDTFSDRIRFIPQRGSWLAWNGHRWLWDEAGLIHEHARAVARGLPGSPHNRDAEGTHKRNTLSARGLRAMVQIASTDPRISTPLSQLDGNPWQLNTPGGAVDLRTGQLLPPDPAALHTRSTAVTPDSAQTPHQWLDFLADTFAGDPELTGYVQRLLGLSLVGQVLEQLLPFAYGEGANGKTTLLGVVQRLLGLGDTGYSISAPSELLLATAATGHPTELARLAGARLVVTSELDDGQRFAEARVKLLTGRDTIAARFMRRDFFDFTPTHTLWLLGNHQPTVRAGGPALWRRIRLIPFLHTVPTEKRIADLEDRLAGDEGPGILAWIITGLTEYLNNGIREPENVKNATAEYAKDQDTVARFVEECCQIGSAADLHMRVKVTELRATYETWCRVEGETPVTAKALTLALRSRYDVTSDRDMNARYYAGIHMTDASSRPTPDLSSDSGDDLGHSEWWNP